MPIITAYPDVVRAYNRVEIDWSDTPSVDWAKVVRVDAETGECTALRPYICYNGDYLNVSCDGHGIFWDTEVPLDRSVYYITEGLDAPCTPPATILDTFTRVTVNGWGSTDTGQAWAHLGTIGDFSVNGNRAIHSHPAANTGRISTVDTGSPNGTFQADFTVPTAASGVALIAFLVGRFTDTNNFYMARIGWTTGNTITLTLRKRVAGVETNLVSITVPVLTFALNTWWTVKFNYQGNLLQAKLWQTGQTEPLAWQVQATDGDLTTGNGAGLRSILDVGSTNVTPFQYQFDNFMSTTCEPCTPVTASTPPTTMPSNGAFRLKDPVRPCNDLYIPLCFTQAQAPDCLPGSGIFFAQMDTESYDANTMILNPTNATNPIAVTRNRRSKASLLQLVTRTFADRDALLAINAPGSPLLLQGPPEYGISQAYISVGTINVDRGLSDHRFPVRINNLPFLTVTRPAGPSQGVCGARVEDSCDLYDTWEQIVDAGLTYEDFVRGQASNNPVVPLRIWDEVNAEFADWNAVEANGTWAQLKAGD